MLVLGLAGMVLILFLTAPVVQFWICDQNVVNTAVLAVTEQRLHSMEAFSFFHSSPHSK